MFKKPVYLALGVLINLGFLLTTYEGRTQGVINLPQTGQTKCYNASRTEIACSGTGQDGELQTGVDWPDPRFAVSGDCVTDNLTGLMWAKNGNLPNGIKTWQGPSITWLPSTTAQGFVAKKTGGCQASMNWRAWSTPARPISPIGLLAMGSAMCSPVTTTGRPRRLPAVRTARIPSICCIVLWKT